MSARVTDLQVHRFPSPASLSFLRSSLPATTESLCAVNSILDNRQLLLRNDVLHFPRFNLERFTLPTANTTNYGLYHILAKERQGWVM
jgi:hypothetical protein